MLEPSRKAIQEALADALMLPELPRRIECFDISHIQGAETVASLVVWEDGKMNKSAYRKFKVMTVPASTISPPCARSSSAATAAFAMHDRTSSIRILDGHTKVRARLQSCRKLKPPNWTGL